MASDSDDLVASEMLFAHAVRLAWDETTRDSDEYWGLIRTLHGRPDREVFERAVACCASSASVERRVGADVLAQIGPADSDGVRPFSEATVPALRELLTDSDKDVIVSAIYALAHHRYALVGDLRDLARHSLAPVRETVAFALSGHATPEAIALLVELTADVDDDVRDWATFAIGTQCDADSDDIRRALRDRLGDADEEVRSEAIVGLARRGDRVVIDRIVEALDGASPSQLIFDAADALLVVDPGEPRITASLARWRDP